MRANAVCLIATLSIQLIVLFTLGPSHAVGRASTGKEIAINGAHLAIWLQITKRAHPPTSHHLGSLLKSTENQSMHWVHSWLIHIHRCQISVSLVGKFKT